MEGNEGGGGGVARNCNDELSEYSGCDRATSSDIRYVLPSTYQPCKCFLIGTLI